jgi:DNA-binding transcriptional ArsR family regulator
MRSSTGATAKAAPRTATDPAVLEQAAAAFGLLASPTRLQIVWILAAGECDVTGLAEQVGGTLPAISQHLAKLRLAGLVRSRREGRRQVYLVDDPYLAAVVRLMIGQLAGQDADQPGPDPQAGPGAFAAAGLQAAERLARGHFV